MSGVVLWAMMLVTLVALTGVSRAQESFIDPRVQLREGINREALDAEEKETYDLIVNPTNPHRYGLPTPIGMWMHSPKMARHILPAYMYLRYGNSLGRRLTTVAILTTGRELNSPTQWGTHSVNAQRIGLEQEVMDAIGHRGSLEGLGEKDALVIRFGRELFGNRRVSSETFADAIRIIGRRGVADLGGLMAFYRFLFLSSNIAFDLQPGSLPPLPPSEGQDLSSIKRSSPVAAAPGSPFPPDIDPDSRARLPRVNRDDLDDEGKKTYDLIVNPTSPHRYGLPTPIGMWMHNPKMAKHILPAYMYLRFGNPFGVRLTELIILVTAREINSQYQWSSHEPTALKVGLEQEIIDVVKYRRDPDGLGEKENLIIRFGRELIGDERVSPETFTQVLNVFGRRGVTDLAALMALYEFLMLSSNATFDLQMSPDSRPLLPTL